MEMTTRRGRLAAVLVAASVVLAACSGSPSPSPVPSVIRVLGSWEGPEIDAFRAVVKPFEERTGYSVVVSTTRDLKGALERSFEVGDPPDLAGLPGPGYMLELVRKGKLVNLADVIDTGTYLARDRARLRRHRDRRGQARRRLHEGDREGPLLVQPGRHRSRASPRPGTTSSTRPSRHGDRRALVHRARVRRLVGLAGHRLGRGLRPAPERAPGLRRLGRGSGSLVVTGDPPRLPELRHGHRRLGRSAGGVEGVLRTHFSRAGDGLFTDPPKCLFAHQATFMSTFLDEAVAKDGGRYDFIPFPDIEPRFSGALIGAGDLFALTSDTPAGRDLIRYLVSPEAQAARSSSMAARCRGTSRSTDYPNELARRQAELLADRQDPPLRRLRLHAGRDERGLLAGDPRLHRGPVAARPDPRPARRRPGRGLRAGVMEGTRRRGSRSRRWRCAGRRPSRGCSPSAPSWPRWSSTSGAASPPSQRASSRARWACRPSP